MNLIKIKIINCPKDTYWYNWGFESRINRIYYAIKSTKWGKDVYSIMHLSPITDAFTSTTEIVDVVDAMVVGFVNIKIIAEHKETY